MAVAMNSEMAARMVSGCVASSLRPTVNRRPGRAPVLMMSSIAAKKKAQKTQAKTCCLFLQPVVAACVFVSICSCGGSGVKEQTTSVQSGGAATAVARGL
jgi:hypothetical protein